MCGSIAAVRKSVVEILREQNQRFAPGQKLRPEVSRNLDRLAAGAAAIVTGQQVGLFSGPAYTFYKALSAERVTSGARHRRRSDFLARYRGPRSGRGESRLWNTRNGLARYELPSTEADTGRHVGQVRSVMRSSRWSPPRRKRSKARPPKMSRTLFANPIHRGETYGSAFGKLMARLLAPRGIIFIDPLDARFHRLCFPRLSSRD